jgi:hypothetical protein
MSKPSFRTATRNGLPVIVVDEAARRIDPQFVRKILEEEGF